MGEIVNSIAVIGFLAPLPWANHSDNLKQILYYYAVRLDDGALIQLVSEDCLEIFERVSPPVAN
jgi:hypothetical protein